jgi:hypothetical protein
MALSSILQQAVRLLLRILYSHSTIEAAPQWLPGDDVLNRRAHVMTEDFKALLLSLSAWSEFHAALPTAALPRGIVDR